MPIDSYQTPIFILLKISEINKLNCKDQWASASLPLSSQIVEAIKKEKEEAHLPWIVHLNALLKDGRKCFQEIEAKVGTDNVIAIQIQNPFGIKN